MTKDIVKVEVIQGELIDGLPWFEYHSNNSGGSWWLTDEN